LYAQQNTRSAPRPFSAGIFLFFECRAVKLFRGFCQKRKMKMILLKFNISKNFFDFYNPKEKFL